MDRAFDDLWDERDDEEDEVEAEPEVDEASGDDDDPEAFFFGDSGASVSIRFDHTPYDRQFVPEWDDEYEPNTEVLEKLAICIRDDQPVLLVGPKGCGKTSAIESLAAAVKQPLRRINLTNQTRVRDFVGYRTLEYEKDDDGDVRQFISWVDNILPDAARNNHWLLVDEIDASPPGVTLVMQSVLEPRRQLFLPENGGEIVTPPGKVKGQPNEMDKRRFRIFATANTLGYGDDTGFYAGTNVMNAAMLDRFAIVRVDYPKPEIERSILKARTGLCRTVLKKMVEFAALIRKAVVEDDTGITISTRQLVQWGKMIASIWGGDPAKFIYPVTDDPSELCQRAITLAYEMNVSGRLPGDDEDFYAGVFQRVFDFSPRAA